jgi:hypothetical protein
MEKPTIMINNETASVQNVNHSGTVTNISSPMKIYCAVGRKCHYHLGEEE